MKLALALFAAWLVLPTFFTPGNAQSIVNLNTRTGVTQSYFLARLPARPQAIAVLMTGGEGSIRLRTENGQIRFGPNNFLVRVREEFISRDIIAAIPDVPSDRASHGMDDAFRLGESHAIDISAVVADLKKRHPDLPVFILGTSRGTVSTAALGASMGKELAGIALTSTVFVPARPGPGVSRFNFSTITVPVLLVHHAEDGCRVTPYRDARRLSEQRKYPLITVNGGSPARSDPCEPFSAHGFLGREAETVDAMVRWMLGRPYPANIE